MGSCVEPRVFEDIADPVRLRDISARYVVCGSPHELNYAALLGLDRLQVICVSGTVKAHQDHRDKQTETLGLVLRNTVGARLFHRDAAHDQQLPPGSVFSIDSSRQHGTRTASGRHSQKGTFIFAAMDVPVGQMSPQVFANHAIALMEADAEPVDPEIEALAQRLYKTRMSDGDPFCVWMSSAELIDMRAETAEDERHLVMKVCRRLAREVLRGA